MKGSFLKRVGSKFMKTKLKSIFFLHAYRRHIVIVIEKHLIQFWKLYVISNFLKCTFSFHSKSLAGRNLFLIKRRLFYIISYKTFYIKHSYVYTYLYVKIGVMLNFDHPVLVSISLVY